MPSAALPSKATIARPARFQTGRAILALMLREMGSSYGRSPGGYLWAILSPLGAVVIISVGFSLLAHSPPLGTSFMLFYATGYLPFDLYSQLSNRIGAALRFSRPLMAFPRVTWMDAVLARLLLNSLAQITVFCIVIIGIMGFVDTRSLLDITRIATGLAMAICFATGVGLMNCLLIGYFQIWERLWEIVSKPLFLISGVVFLFDEMPPLVQTLLWWNPLVHITGLVRSGFYPNYHADYVSLPYVFGLSLCLIMFAMVFLRRGYLAGLGR
ncbi:MAG: ABC transporter permease [Pseudorhodobacter sp.]|jgi:capsular polysaccharide transport system permease protein|nr:ABC transporter permease [Pseudorhodobacter sp.]